MHIDVDPVDAEPVEDTEFRFDLDHQGIVIELGASGWLVHFRVVFAAVVRFFNLLASLWNGLLAMLMGQPVPEFKF